MLSLSWFCFSENSSGSLCYVQGTANRAVLPLATEFSTVKSYFQLLINMFFFFSGYLCLFAHKSDARKLFIPMKFFPLFMTLFPELFFVWIVPGVKLNYKLFFSGWQQKKEIHCWKNVFHVAFNPHCSYCVWSHSYFRAFVLLWRNSNGQNVTFGGNVSINYKILFYLSCKFRCNFEIQ